MNTQELVDLIKTTEKGSPEFKVAKARLHECQINGGTEPEEKRKVQPAPKPPTHDKVKKDAKKSGKS